jgi:hypothetical protein
MHRGGRKRPLFRKPLLDLVDYISECKRDGGSASLRVECAACDRPRRGGLAVCGGGSGGGENEGDGNGLSMASSISKVCGLAQSPL